MNLPASDVHPDTTRQLFLFDARVPDIETLVATLPAGSRWAVIDARQDGLAQVAEALGAQDPGTIDTVHLVSHGAPGVLLLGDGPVDLAGLAPRAEVLARIGAQLAPGGELRLYGCAVGLGADGEAFVETLGRLAAARVAASDDPTGAGGDWILEIRSGPSASAATDTDSGAVSDPESGAVGTPLPHWPADASALSGYAATLWIHQDQAFGTGRYLTGGGLIQGGAGNDLIAGDEGSRREYIDPFTGLWVYSPVEGYDLRDTLFGGAGDDSLYGRNGDDQLYGDAGNDLLDSGLGNNLLVPGPGSDTIHGGGTGTDTLRLEGLFGPAPSGIAGWEIEIEPPAAGAGHLAAYNALTGEIDLFRDIDRVAFDNRVIDATALRAPDTGRLLITDAAWRLRGDTDASAVPVTRTPGFGAPQLGPFSLDGRVDVFDSGIGNASLFGNESSIGSGDSVRVHGVLSWGSRIALTLDGERFDLASGAADFDTPLGIRLAGLDLDVGAMSLDGEQALLSATLTLPAVPGAVVPAGGDIDGSGIDLGVRLRLTPDTIETVGDDLQPGFPLPATGLRIADRLDVTLSQGVLRYEADDDAFTLDGVLTLGATGPLPALAFRPIDDAGGETRLRIEDGALQPARLQATPADFEHTGIAFSDARLTLALGAPEALLSGSAQVRLPFAPDAASVPASLEFSFEPFALTRARIDHTPETPIRILATPVTIESLDGSLEGFGDETAGTRLTGAATLTLGTAEDLPSESETVSQTFAIPEEPPVAATAQAATARFTLTGDLDASGAHGTLRGGLLRPGLLDLDGEARFDWAAGTLAFEGVVSALDGRLMAPMRFDSPLDIELTATGIGRADLGAAFAPAHIALAYSADADASNDRADAWIRIDASFGAGGESPRTESLAIGRTWRFDGSEARLGAVDLPGDGGWHVDDGAAGLLIEARWEMPATAPVRTRIVRTDPGGTQPSQVIDEADYAANGIALIDALGSPTGRAVWIAEPSEGAFTYDLELIADAPLGAVTRSAAVTRTPMAFDAGSAVIDGSTLRVDYDAIASTGASVCFFLDDDAEGFDGRPIGAPLPVDASGRVEWTLPAMPAGRYWVYGVLTSDADAPVFDYAAEPVTVRTAGAVAPELAITSADDARPEGDTGTTRFEFVVTRSGDLTEASTVRWAVSSGDADEADFADAGPAGLPSGELRFATGQAQATITIEALGDTLPETDERFTVTLSEPVWARLATTSAQATIGNDDLRPGIVLNGTAASEVLQGGPEDETLVGGGGDDTLIGGAGNDTHVVDSASDVVVELAGGGIDTVISSVSRTLGDQQEHLVLAGAAHLDGTGNALANRIVGNTGNNVLRGLFGADTLEGGPGNDTYVLDSPLDVVIERDGEGVDTVMAPVAWTLGPNLEHLVLTGPASIAGTGNALANRIDGNTGDNTLTGGGGTDTLAGGPGDDLYVVDSVDDVVIEVQGAGTDTVRTSVTRALGDHQEHLVLTGDAAIDGTGNALANRIDGNAAANTLTGLGGADTLVGGGGNDVFRFVGRSDSALGATDTIVDFGVGDRLLFDGATGLAHAPDSVNWAGGLASTIAAIRADGGLAGRIVRFTDATDTWVYVNGAGTGVSFDGTLIRLAGREIVPSVVGVDPAPVRDLARTGTDGPDALTGGAGDDTLAGLAGNDTLTGLAGDDRLDGGDGTDWALFSGALSGYELRRDAFGVTVADLQTDRDGLDTGVGLERLKFTDMSVNLTVQASAASIDPAALDRIAELYVGFFGRVPAADGLENWVLQHRDGRPLSTIADDFHAIGTSPALRERTGYWNLEADTPLSDDDYVALVYRNVLGREGKPGGIAYWSAQLRPGNDGAPAAETRGSLVATMLDAAHALKGDDTWGWVADLLDDRVAMSKRVAVEWGLNYGATPDGAIALGAAIAGAVDQRPNPDPAFADIPVKTFDFDAAVGIIGIDPARIDLFG